MWASIPGAKHILGVGANTRMQAIPGLKADIQKNFFERKKASDEELKTRNQRYHIMNCSDDNNEYISILAKFAKFADQKNRGELYVCFVVLL